MNVIKRDGREVQFQREKIINAISKASNEVSKSGVAEIPQSIINGIAEELENKYTAENYAVSVEYIQDDIEMDVRISDIDMNASFIEMVILLTARSCLL